MCRNAYMRIFALIDALRIYCVAEKLICDFYTALNIVFQLLFKATYLKSIRLMHIYMNLTMLFTLSYCMYESTTLIDLTSFHANKIFSYHSGNFFLM